MNHANMPHALVVTFNAQQLPTLVAKASTLVSADIDIVAFCDQEELKRIKLVLAGEAYTQLALTLHHYEDQVRLVSHIKDAVIYRPDIAVFVYRSWPLEARESDLVKALFEYTQCRNLYLAGHSRWAESPKMLATVDVLDDSAAQRKLDETVLARTESKRQLLSGSMHLLSVVPMSFFTLELEIKSQGEVRTQRLSEVMDKQQTLALQAELDCDFLQYVEAGAPYEEIQSTAKRINADLVVLGNVGRTGVTGLFIGNTAEKILTHLRVDALIVR